MSFTTGPSRWRDVWLATTARGTTMCGEFLATTALALALQARGADGLAVSGLLLAATLPLVALAPLTGRLADRVDSRILLVVAGTAQSLICLVLAHTEHPIAVVALVGALACGLAVTQPCLAALLPAMVRREDLPRASAIQQTAVSVGALGGPVLAGFLVGQFGTRVPLLLNAACYLALVAAGLLLRTRRGGRRVTAGAGASAPAPAWRLRRDPLMLVMVVTTAAVITAIGGMSVVEVFYIRETLGGSATMYGLVGAAWMAGLLPGSWLAARPARRFTDDAPLVRGVLLTLGGCALVVVLAAAVPAAALLIPLWIAGGAANGGVNVFANVLTARRVPEPSRARAYAVNGAVIQGGSMAGYLIGGVLLAVAPPRAVIAGLGVAGLLVVAAFVPFVSRAVRVDRTGASAGPETGPGRPTVAAVLATPTRPAEPAQITRDTVGAWSSTSRAPGSGTSSS